jgi:hypothetical protein
VTGIPAFLDGEALKHVCAAVMIGHKTSATESAANIPMLVMHEKARENAILDTCRSDCYTTISVHYRCFWLAAKG